MAAITFRHTNFKRASLDRIEQMQKIVAQYAKQNLRLTARQLYYQFVARDLIPNTPTSYKNLTGLLADARYAGMIDWDAIEDRGREPTVWRDYENVRDFVDSSIRGYRLPRWADQDTYVELWVEKQALAGVLEPLAAEYHATLMVNKGYSSASAMFESAQRFIGRSNQAESDSYDGSQPEKSTVLFYLGDHDPSGEDMVRDIRDRLKEFGVERLDVQKLALTMDQIRQYNPPPNPAKTSDSRYEAYAREHGASSWEVDALPPDVLQQIIRTAFNDIVDRRRWDAVLRRERNDKERLRKAAESLVNEGGQ